MNAKLETRQNCCSAAPNPPPFPGDQFPGNDNPGHATRLVATLASRSRLGLPGRGGCQG